MPRSESAEIGCRVSAFKVGNKVLHESCDTIGIVRRVFPDGNLNVDFSEEGERFDDTPASEFTLADEDGCDEDESVEAVTASRRRGRDCFADVDPDVRDDDLIDEEFDDFD